MTVTILLEWLAALALVLLCAIGALFTAGCDPAAAARSIAACA